ncbi:MAG TPA: thioredoxin domain-containing protein [Blastocatellia bacterium]
MRRFILFLVSAMTALTVAQPDGAWPLRSQTSSGQSPARASSSKPAEKPPADCGCEINPAPAVLASVNGGNVLSKDVDEPIKDRIKAIQDRVVEARNRELDLQINTRLLDAEAKRLGIASDELLAREVIKKMKEPTEAQARAFYDQNKGRIEGEFKDTKDQIINYLRSQAEQEEAKNLAERLRGRAQVKVLVETVTPPASDAERARVFATVNGKPITSGDIEDALKPIIFSVQEQIYDLRKKELDLRINDLLLDQEAKKQNKTPDALYESEISPRVRKITDDDARKFYDENKNKINGTFAEVRAQIVQYLENREQSNAASSYAERLRSRASVQVFLRPPDPPVFEISIEDRPWKGGTNAPVTVIEFTDFECPSCGATQPDLEEVAREFGDKVKLVARNFPLDQHKHAFEAAEAAEAAREQGKYWEYAALLFKNQKALETEKLKEYASQVGLDRKRFDAALDSHKYAGRVKQDLVDGEKVGIDSTPTLFINGKRVRARTREDLKAAIEAALKEAARK